MCHDKIYLLNSFEPNSKISTKLGLCLLKIIYIECECILCLILENVNFPYISKKDDNSSCFQKPRKAMKTFNGAIKQIC